MKRAAALILSLIVFICAFTPCCAVDNCLFDQPISKTGKQEPVKQKEGTCSPFFSCATCAGFVHLSKPIQVPIITAQKPVHHEKVNSLITDAHPTTPFQPPRLA
jgi:hypothetical protein